MGERKKDFEWRYQPAEGSDNAKMLTYIQSLELHPSQDKTAMIVSALTSFYMPLALLSHSNEDSTHLKLVTMDCLKAIVYQFKYICAVKQIEPQSVACFWSDISYQITMLSNSGSVEISDNENDNFDLNDWNLTGITTDSEIFELSN
jgi:hypothetical protein